MNDIGHNQPPDMSITVGEVAQNLSDWMKDNPVIDELNANAAKVKIDVGKLAIADLEAERTAKVKPLNEQVKTINEGYRAPRELLRKVLDELEYRVTDFLAKKEAKRIAKAEEARLAAEAAKRTAMDAEREEKESLDNASSHGEAGIDVLAKVEEADRAFAAYKTAHHQAQIAEREAENVRLGGGFTRALSLRSTEVLSVTDLLAAVEAMKNSERIIEAVIKAARSYKKVYGKYPPGIEVQIERKV